jgi:hypothetical protein
MSTLVLWMIWTETIGFSVTSILLQLDLIRTLIILLQRKRTFWC